MLCGKAIFSTAGRVGKAVKSSTAGGWLASRFSGMLVGVPRMAMGSARTQSFTGKTSMANMLCIAGRA